LVIKWRRLHLVASAGIGLPGYGLTSSIYTKDIDTVMRACNKLKFGET
jgi:acyl-CoA reductase-like NAD-dependent aldehyde dehydrogenase